MQRHRLYETWPAEVEALSPIQRPLVFDADIRPNRSLPSLGFMAVMGALIAMSFTAGLVFWIMGAWPVIGFFGLDIVLVWLAFKLSYRQGRQVETVQINPQELRVTRQWPSGHCTQYRMAPAWARVDVRGKGKSDVQICLSAMGKHLIVGTQLSPKEREDLAQALESALGRAKRADFSPVSA